MFGSIHCKLSTGGKGDITERFLTQNGFCCMHQEDFLTNSSSSIFLIDGRGVDSRLAGKIPFDLPEVS